MTSAPGAGEVALHAILPRGALLAHRYRIGRLLGQGAMGRVYEASDEARGGLPVAVKLLAVLQPRALSRLKNEFRALAETVHPNLVGLHGLGSDPHGWFVVMELIVPCSDFVSYVRPGLGDTLDVARLRSALAQLLQGLCAIHAAGKLHRDLKPSNVLVTPEGRVRIADFGMVGDQDPDDTHQTHDRRFVGTPAYAAPEQADGAVGPKADLYAVGVLLYEALTRKLPIEAESTQLLLARKARESAPDPLTVAPGLPDDLSALCRALLRRDPALRPDAMQALAELDVQTAPVVASRPRLFVAREAELTALRAAMRRAREGTPVVTLVGGPSGIGKTALVNHFLELSRAEPGAVTLRGRCHVHEQLPYNAFDALIDALGGYLAKLAPLDAASLMPRDIALLARLFPTLLGVPAVLQMPAGRVSEIDEGLHRPRAFAALKELLARIADRAPLVLCFDDLQWSDDDSLELLRELLRAPGAPACLFLCALRGDDLGESDLPGALLRAAPGVVHVELRLGPLKPQAAGELARAVLGAACPEAQLRLLIEECGGSPFLLQELSRGASATGRVTGLQAMVDAAIDALAADARELLEIVCSAGRPVESLLALRAAAAAPRALPAVLASGLLRSSTRRGREYLESTHDRLRDAVLGRLDGARRALLHEQLADALVCEEAPDPEVVAQHYRAAGLLERAAPHTLEAAARAARALAFGRAKELYELALAGAPDAQRGGLEVARADACAKLGRLSDAAEGYERAAQLADPGTERRALLSRAMVLHLLATQIERGAVLAHQLCQELGVLAPPRAAWLASLVRLVLFLRYWLGPRITSTAAPLPAPGAGAPGARERLELCFRASRGFLSRPDACFHFSMLSLIAVRRQRDPRHWPLAMAAEVLWRSFLRSRASDRDRFDLSRALALATAQGDEEHIAVVLTTQGLCELNDGSWDAAIEAFERAEEALFACNRSVIPVFHSTRSGRIAAWINSGRYTEVLRHGDTWTAEARALGDHMAELVVQQLCSHGFLALDDPSGARAAITAARAGLGDDNLLAADAWWLGDVALYEGNPEAALEEDARARRTRYFRFVQRVRNHRIWCAAHLARASLMAAAAGAPHAHLRRVAQQIRSLERERTSIALAGAAQASAGLAMLRGDTARAQEALQSALDLYTRAGMRLHAEAARFRLGALYGGSAGDALVSAAKQAGSALGLHNPPRWFRVFAPGFPG